MNFIIKAYRSDHSEILGNLDGQGIIVAKNYKKTKRYKNLENFKTLNNKVAYYKLFKCIGFFSELYLETVKNKNITHC